MVDLSTRMYLASDDSHPSAGLALLSGATFNTTGIVTQRCIRSVADTSGADCQERGGGGGWGMGWGGVERSPNTYRPPTKPPQASVKDKLTTPALGPFDEQNQNNLQECVIAFTRKHESIGRPK